MHVLFRQTHLFNTSFGKCDSWNFVYRLYAILNTGEPRYNEPLYNEVLGIANNFCQSLGFVIQDYTVKFRKLAPGIIFFKGPFWGAYHKPLKKGLIFGGAYLRREICVQNRFGLALKFEGEITVFALFYLVFEVNFPSTSPRGPYIWRGDLTEAFLRYRFGGLYLEGLIFGILRYRENLLPFSIVPRNETLSRFFRNFGP